MTRTLSSARPGWLPVVGAIPANPSRTVIASRLPTAARMIEDVAGRRLRS